MAQAAAPETKKTFFDKFAEFMDAYPGSALRETLRLIPDGLFLGTGFFALITQNFPLAMMFLALFEALLITVGLQNITSYIDLPATAPNPQAKSLRCLSGFQSPTLEQLSFFFKLNVKSAFPSPPVFIATVAYSYVIAAMQGFTAEIQELGSSFSTRYYIGILLSGISLFILTLFRLLNNCEGVGVLAMSLIFGFAVGLILCWQNNTIFGRESTNILGIPIFKNRTEDGKPIYVCPTLSKI